jgi:hypothetical protein
MKNLTIYLYLLLQLIATASDDRMQWLEERRSWIERAKEKQDETTILNLSRILTGVGRNLSSTSPEAKELYEQAQATLLSVPGHATYFRDKIISAKVDVRSGKLNLSVWQRLVMNNVDVLKHLPSEETVAVLMEFVGDDFASLASNDPADYEIPGLKQMVFWDMSVHGPATRALSNLGIVNPPFHSPSGGGGKDSRDAWLQWWSEVQQGKRKYRFKGSDVGYPVSGTIGTTQTALRPERRPIPPDKQTASPYAVKDEALNWFVPSLIIALLVVGYLAYRRSFSH